jgi:hypothetical protein
MIVPDHSPISGAGVAGASFSKQFLDYYGQTRNPSRIDRHDPVVEERADFSTFPQCDFPVSLCALRGEKSQKEKAHLHISLP